MAKKKEEVTPVSGLVEQTITVTVGSNGAYATINSQDIVNESENTVVGHPSRDFKTTVNNS